MSGTLLPIPKIQLFDDNGNPLAGGKVYFYLAGTSTPRDTYSDRAMTTPNENPVILNGAGRATIYLAPVSYKVIVRTSADALVYTQDNVDAIGLVGASTALTSVNDGRLTLTSGTPVTVADVVGTTFVYFTPFTGTRLALYDGLTWAVYNFAELTLALDVTYTGDTNYDVFGYVSGGAVALQAVAWASGTARATAIVRQDGVWVKSGAPTHRYLGSFRTQSFAGQVEDSAQFRYVFNAQNRVIRPLRKKDATASWTYTTSTLRQARASADNLVAVLIGLAEAALELEVIGVASNTNTAVTVSVNIGEDSTSAHAAESVFGAAQTPLAGANVTVRATLRKTPAIGKHAYAWLEISSAVGTTTWLGASANLVGCGITGSVEA